MPDDRLAVVLRRRWLVEPAEGRYFGFPRAVTHEGVHHIKIVAGAGTGRPGMHQQPPVNELIVVWDPDSSAEVWPPVYDFVAWQRSFLRNRSDREVFAPLLLDGGVMRFVTESGWMDVLLGGPAIRLSGGSWLWPIYGRVRRGAPRHVRLVKSGPLGQPFEIIGDIEVPGLDLSECGGVELEDGSIVLVVRAGDGFDDPAVVARCTAVPGSVSVLGAAPFALHWPVVATLNGRRVVVIGRGSAGLVMAEFQGGSWHSRLEVLAPPAAWFGNAVYAAILPRDEVRMDVVTYGPVMEGVAPDVGREYPGVFGLEVYLGWTVHHDGRVRPFRGGITVQGDELRVPPGLRGFRRLPMHCLGESAELVSGLFGGHLPSFDDYTVELE